MGTLSTNGKNITLDSGVPSPVYIQLHTGDPGADGTANVATETTRKAISLGAASNGTRTGSGAVQEWTNYPAAETISWVSAWNDASASGATNYLGKHQLASPKSPGVGDKVTLDPANVSFSV